jgi:hypothetical protein
MLHGQAGLQSSSTVNRGGNDCPIKQSRRLRGQRSFNGVAICERSWWLPICILRQFGSVYVALIRRPTCFQMLFGSLFIGRFDSTNAASRWPAVTSPGAIGHDRNDNPHSKRREWISSRPIGAVTAMRTSSVLKWLMWMLSPRFTLGCD